MITAAAVVLAGCSPTALGAFVLAGLLKPPFFAVLGELVRPPHTAMSAVRVLSLAGRASRSFVNSDWRSIRFTYNLSR
ncbi:hypothetical protein ABTY98_16750 [Streptomyces sp. NPDC096040]|uniref:hypothetical protein n=1 Tax=Streptomyces sp. NPDC096040 TaxID=3155541 RepID=UPI00331EDBD6